MKLKHVLKRVITLLMCASMVINTINVGATEMGGGEGQPSVAAETGSTNLLKNGLFADTDGNGEADSWNYYHGDYAKASSSVLTDGGVEIACVSNVNERITLYQQNIATTDMEYILTGDVNIATLVSGGNITFKLTATDSCGKTEALTSDAYNTKGSQSVSKTFTITELSNVVKVKLEIIVSNGATMAVTLNNISLKGTTTQLELITDGTFETDVNGDGQADAWTYYKGASELADTVLVDGGGIKINCETKKRLTLHQTLLSGIETGKTYVLSGEVNVSATTYGALTVRYITQDSKGTQIEKNENANYKFTSTTDGWQNVFYEIPVTDANVTRIKVEIEVSAGATLTASVRDFSLVEKVEEVTNKNYIQNPEFVVEDGKTATLTQDEKTIELRLFDENGSDYKFETMNAYAYGATEPGAGENANEGITKIFINATDVQKAVFNVLLTPEGEKSPEVKALKDWVTYDFSTLKEDNSANDEIGAVLSGYTLSLEGNIGVNFYMELEAEVAASETAYMEFILPNGTKEKVFVKDAVPVTEKGDESEPDKIYHVFSCEVASDEMTEEIKAQFIVDESTKSPVYSYTVKAYADYILKNEALYPAKTVDLVKAMLNYGAYSQQYFGTNENVLANEDLSEEDKFLPSSDENDQKGLLTKYKASAVTKEGLGTFASAYLVLESETTLKVRFKPAEGINVDELTFTVEGAAAKTVMSGNDVMIVVENIKAQDLDKNYAFVATYGADELEFSCSTMSYGNVILNIETNEVYTTELKSLVCALYNYNQAADVYCEN